MSTSTKTQAQTAMWCAISRSGVVNVRKGTGEFAVDVATRGMPQNRTYRVFRVFATAKAAQAFADACNGGKHPDAKLAPKLHDAIVVPAWPVPAEGKPWPWETPAGKRKLNAARKASQPKAPAKA